jgi:hypothetical protein
MDQLTYTMVPLGTYLAVFTPSHLLIFLIPIPATVRAYGTEINLNIMGIVSRRLMSYGPQSRECSVFNIFNSSLNTPPCPLS